MFQQPATKLFKDLVLPYVDYFESLKSSLKKADMRASVEEYLSLVLFCGLVVFVVSMIFFMLLLPLVIQDFAYIYTLGIVISFSATGIAILLGYYYPSLQARTIKSEIEKSLPFAASYMTTSASSGINPVEVFKMLALRGGRIGEDANRIYTNITSLGMDMAAALQKAASRTPSNSFADLLWGMASVITSGGDIEAYLKGKTRTYMNQYRRSLEDYAKQISLYTEIYITLIIVGSLLFIVLIAVVSPLVGGSVLFIQTFLVFFMVPLVSLAFIVLLKAISPSE
jgi:flagellar protein FlaJ